MLVDVHAHLDDKAFDKDLKQVISRAIKNDFVTIINCGINSASNKKTLSLAKEYEIVKAALGFFPTEALKVSEADLQKELEFIKKNKNKIIAISEVGLDYKYNKEKDKQKNIFLKFVSLAEKINKPLIIHSRNAEQDVIDICKSSNLKKIIFHCFTGKQKQIKEIEENNWSFSIPSIIVRYQQFQNLVDKVSLSNILTETDSPLLSPYQNKRNEPSFIKENIKKIAEIKKITIEETQKIIFMNFQKFFLKK